MRRRRAVRVAQPTGKLPQSSPTSTSQEPLNDGDGKVPLFPFGFGLGYGGGATTRDPYAVIQAESFGSQSGIQVETTTDTDGGQNVGFIAPGDWIAYPGLDFGSPTALRVTTRWASGATTTGTVQYRLDSLTGPVIASVAISSSAGWQTWRSATTTLADTVTGVHTVFLTFTGPSGEFVKLNWLQFAR